MNWTRILSFLLLTGTLALGAPGTVYRGTFIGDGSQLTGVGSVGTQTPLVTDVNGAGKQITNLNSLISTGAVTAASFRGAATNQWKLDATNAVHGTYLPGTNLLVNSVATTGINTNGAVAGNVLTFRGGTTVWSNPPAGGAGSTDLTTASNLLQRITLVHGSTATSDWPDLGTAMSNAVAGDTVFLGPGNFVVSNAISMVSGTHLVGAGAESIIESYVSLTNGGVCIAGATGASVENLQITNVLMDVRPQACIGTRYLDSQPAFTNFTTRNLLCWGDGDSWYANHTNTCDWTDYGSKFFAKWDSAAEQNCNITNTIYGTVFFSKGPSVYTPGAAARCFTTLNVPYFTLIAYGASLLCEGGASQTPIILGSGAVGGTVTLVSCSTKGSLVFGSDFPQSGITLLNTVVSDGFTSAFENGDGSAPTFQPWVYTPQIITATSNLMVRGTDFGVAVGTTWQNLFGADNLLAGTYGPGTNFGNGWGLTNLNAANLTGTLSLPVANFGTLAVSNGVVGNAGGLTNLQSTLPNLFSNTVTATPLTNTVTMWLPVTIGGTNYYIPLCK